MAVRFIGRRSITNFHILAGRYPVSKIAISKYGIPNEVAVFYRIGNTNSVGSFKIPLYHPDKKNAFYVMPSIDKKSYVDIAAIGMSKPPSEVNTIEFNEIDTSINIAPGSSLLMAGFPNGVFIDGWKPTVLKAVSAIPKTLPYQMLEKSKSFMPIYIFLDKELETGASGSPIYLFNKNTTKVVGVNSMSPDSLGEEIKGAGILMKYVIDMISR